ncbi:MAG TPA: transporter substrate-binding domain-containing protein [Acidimicrobiia bacterium]|nr:transporter substrate-binding domain-containing protein [Acidimicrobiia bacterium]
MKSKTRLFAVLAVLALVVAACGDDGEGGGDTGDFELIEAGTLTICTDVPFPPMEFEDSDSELGYDGFDIQLAAAIAEDLGLTPVVATPGFDAITGGLAFDDDSCDVAAASITITDEREEVIDFSDAYFNSEQSLLVKADSGFTTWEDLSTVAAQTGTTGQIYAEENFEGVEVVTFEDAAGPYLALDAGEVDGVIFDLVNQQAVADEDDTVTVIENYDTGEEYGLATKDSPNLLAAINESLAGFREDGTYDEIYAAWFPEA